MPTHKPKKSVNLPIVVMIAWNLLVVYSALASPSTNPPFSATCQDVVAHAYRDGTDISGKSMGEEWTTDERFSMVWKFSYKGGKDITIDDKQAYVILQHPGVLIAIEGRTNGYASGMWSYAIHLGMKRIVASQVNAAGDFDPELQEVKARSVNLSCTFAFHAAKPPSVASNWQDIMRQAQKRLKTLGFDPGAVDGVMGPHTQQALRTFQRAHGLSPNGKLDTATRKALGVE